ncbi:unnamed protein product, partial [Didymodactylos carnosus]
MPTRNISHIRLLRPMLATTRDSTFQLTNEPSLELQSAVKLLLRQNTMWDMNIKSLCWAVASNYICDTCEH